MKNAQFPFLLMDRNKNNLDDESDSSNNKNEKFKLNKFEKFKPKNDFRRSQIYLKGAESQLKSMLSVLFKDIEQEEKNPNVKDNNNNLINKKNQKDLISNKFKRRETKRNSAASSKLTFGHTTNNNLKFDKNRNFNFKNQLVNNNLKKLSNNKVNMSSTGSTFIFNMNLHKNEGININFLNKYKNMSNITNIGESEITSTKKIKNKKINASNSIIESTLSSGNKIKDMNSINDSKQSLLMTSDFNKPNLIKFKRTKSLISENMKYGSVSSTYGIAGSGLMNNMKNIKEKKKRLSNAIKQQNSYKNNKYENINENINNDKSKQTQLKYINKNNVFNDLKRINSTILSEGSIYNHNFLEEINRKPSNTINKEIKSILSLKNMKDKNKTNLKKSFLKNNPEKNNSKLSNEIVRLKRANTIHSDIKNDYISNKLLKNSLLFKSIQKKLKESIIIRPEELKKNTNNSSIPPLNLKNNRKSKSGINLPYVNLKKTKIKLEKINKKDLNKKNKSSTTNIRVFVPKEKKEKIKKNVEKKITPDNVQISKKVTLKKSPSIKRKSVVVNSKYRLLRRKPILYDSLDDEECEDAEEINNIFIHPNSKFILFFDYITLIFSGLISFIMVPSYLALTHDFCQKEELFDLISVLFMFTELLNIIDLFLSFFKGYYNWDEQLIYRKRKILKHYLSGWFIFDLISAIPIYTINKIHEPICIHTGLSNSNYNNILNIPHYLLLNNRLFKICKIFYNNQAWKYLSNNLNEYTSMIINIMFVLLALNYAGCLYIFVARNNYPNWILNTNLDTSSFLDIYICSIYILIMAITTVGYGDITCYSFWERVFQIFLLVIGIMAYSWAVTSFSNYIKKINEKSADFENKKQILDEIKLNNQNLPDELYEKILRHLKFKNFHEKKLKNIIFDCLPVSLKNSLIFEMYKPIIKNFIFFKNFQNTDFIVRVILVFRPVIAGKNDILINDTDLVEDIMFVKKGILSVELPINMTNPQENIDKYLNMSLEPQKGQELYKPMNTTLLYSKLNNNLNNNIKNTNFKNTIGTIWGDSKNDNPNLRKSTIGYNTTIFGNGFDLNYQSSSLGNNQTISEKDKKEKDVIRYVRILCIRENEHFGDVMMFLEQRSPLRVRVKSKKAELFFLRKMDALKISTSYPNIWRRINKKSVFNFKQIKKSINKIVELYSSVKKLYSIEEEEESSNSLYSELIKKKKGEKEETAINIRPKKFVLNDPDRIKDKQKSFSFQKLSNTSIKRIFKKRDMDILSNKNLTNKMSKSSKILTNNNNNNNNKLPPKTLFYSSSLKKKNNKRKHYTNIIKKVKFDSNINFNENKIGTIKEERSKEDMISQLKSTNSFKNISKVTISSRNNKIKFTSTNNESNIKTAKENNENKYINNSIYNKNKIIVKNNEKNINKSIKRCLKTLKLDDSSSVQLINDENFDVFENNEENQSNLSFDKVINNEIYPGEEIKVNKEENLLLKKVNYDYPAKKHNIKFKNSKIQLLLKYLDDNEVNRNININNISINDNSHNNFYNIKKNDSNNLIDSQIFEKQRVWENNNLFITNNISFKYLPSYENCNIICGGKLINNRINQFKLKKILRDEILYTNSSIKARKSIDLGYNKAMSVNIINNIKQNKKEKIEISTLNSSQTSSFLSKPNKKKFRKCASLLSNSYLANSSSRNKPTIHRTTSFNKKLKKNNNFQDDINLTGRKNNKKIHLLSSKSIVKYNRLINCSSEKARKKSMKVNPLVSPHIKPKKKKDDLLSKINSNIRKTNQNLNNPDEFYSNYFSSIMHAFPKMKKDRKNSFIKDFTLKK